MSTLSQLFESNLVSSLARDINSVQPASSMCTGPDGSLYICYVAGDLTTRLAKRTGILWSEVTICTQIDDAHQTGCVAVDCQGYVHVTAKTHNSPIQYWRSNESGDIFSLEPRSMTPGTSNPHSSYPILTRAGDCVWLTYRTGTSGSGDTKTAIYEYDSNGIGTWRDVHNPLVTGFVQIPSPTDSQYLGCMRGLEDGSLLLTWTHRVNEIEPVNRGLFFAQLYPSGVVLDARGVTSYIAPLNRNLTGNLCIVPISDPTLTNSELAVDVSLNGFHVAFNKYSQEGYREIYHAKFRGGSSGKWMLSQVTSHKRPVTPSTSICTVAPLPCDLSLQGPQMICKDGKIVLFYTIPTRESRVGAWSRLPGEMHISVSGDDGDTWEEFKYNEDIQDRSGEFQRSSSGESLLLHQCVSNAEGVLKVIDIEPVFSLPTPRLKASVDLNGSQMEIQHSGAYTFTGGFSLRFRFQPKRNSIMCIASKEHHFRVFYFGENGNPGNTFNTSGNLQIGVDSSIVYCNAEDMKVGEWIDLLLVWKQNEGEGSFNAEVYRNGNLLQDLGVAFPCVNSVGPFILGGFVGYSQYSFAGSLKFEYYVDALSSEQVELLYQLT